MIATTNCRHGVPPAECERCKRVAQLTETLQALRKPSVCRHGQEMRECQDCRLRVTPRRRRPRPRGASAGLLILEALATSGSPCLTREQLVVAAWRRSPETFSLRGEALPDSARVYCAIDGKRGLVARGHLVKTADGYRLAEEVTDAT